MNYLYDTNILLFIARDRSNRKVAEKMNPDNKIVYVSNANIAEIESIALQNNWDKGRLKRLEQFLDNVRIIEMNDTLLLPMLTLTPTPSEGTQILIHTLLKRLVIWASTIYG